MCGRVAGRGRAATHWAYVDLLPLVGARHEMARIVRDGNVITSGGVSAGIDFAFSIVAELAGAAVAGLFSSPPSMTRLLHSTPAIPTRRLNRP